MLAYTGFPYQDITWWERFLLLFIPEQKVSDTRGDWTTTVYFKTLKGKVFITDVIRSFSIDIILGE